MAIRQPVRRQAEGANGPVAAVPQPAGRLVEGIAPEGEGRELGEGLVPTAPVPPHDGPSEQGEEDGHACPELDAAADDQQGPDRPERLGVVEERSEEHTSELPSLMRSWYAVFCLQNNKH